MESLRLLATLFPLALASGVNLYATILVTGFSIKMGWIENYPSGLEILSSETLLIVTAIFYLLEFFADKIQIIDTVWDSIHTVIRPLGTALIALAAVYEFDPTISVLAAIAGGSVSLVSHSAKTGTRFSINVLSPLENIKNILISLVEDILVGVFSFLALKYPYLTAFIAIVLFVVLIILIPAIFRWLFFTLGAVFSLLTSFLRKKRDSDVVTGEYMALLKHREVKIAVKSKSQGIPKVNGKVGIIVLFSDSVCFCYKKCFGFKKKIWELSIKDIKGLYLRKRILVDILEVHFENEKRKSKIVRFLVLKNRSLLLSDMEKHIKSKMELYS